MVFFQVQFERLHHPDNFFLANFLAAANRVLVRTVVQQCIPDQILAPDQQSGTLRTAHSFAPAERDQVVSHVGVIPQMRHRGRIRGCIIHAWNVVLLPQLDPFVNFDLPRRIGKIRKMHHRRPIAHRLPHLIASFDLHQFDPGISQLVIERVAMRFLNDDFRFHAGEIRYLADE